MYLFGCFVSQLRHVGSFVCNSWALELVSWIIEARGLSCSMACDILVPWPRIKSTSPALRGRFLTTGPPGNARFFCPWNFPGKNTGMGCYFHSISYPWSRDQTEFFVSPASAEAFFTTVPPGKLLFSFCWLHLINEKIITIIIIFFTILFLSFSVSKFVHIYNFYT